jgi:hypothetical protein
LFVGPPDVGSHAREKQKMLGREREDEGQRDKLRRRKQKKAGKRR